MLCLEEHKQPLVVFGKQPMNLVKKKKQTHYRKLKMSQYQTTWLSCGVLVTAGLAAVEVCLWEGIFSVLALNLFLKPKLFAYTVESVALPGLSVYFCHKSLLFIIIICF